jgi:carboxypeptidase C (cathepsin A)
MLAKSLLIAGIAATAVLGQIGPIPDTDRVFELEGQPLIKTDIKMYSGYLNITRTKKQLHYVGVLSQNDPVNDPIFLMIYGGGCSSLVGYALEHGPYIIDDTIPATMNNFTYNKNSWSKNATVIYLETPAGTGFSNCGDEAECSFNDTSAAKDNLEAVLVLLQEKFVIL